MCKTCGAAASAAADSAPSPPDSGVFSGSVPSFADAHRRLRQFAAAWRAAGRPPLTALAFDVAKAFDNVDTAKVRRLLQESVIRNSRWEVRRGHHTFRARGRVVSKCAPSWIAPSLPQTLRGTAVAGLFLSRERGFCRERRRNHPEKGSWKQHGGGTKLRAPSREQHRHPERLRQASA